MNISFTSWDFKQLSRETAGEALTRLLRLLANLLSSLEIGQDLSANQVDCFRRVLQTVRTVLARRLNLAKDKELALCGLSLLANLLFYEK